jgi:hypothetical protein
VVRGLAIVAEEMEKEVEMSYLLVSPEVAVVADWFGLWIGSLVLVVMVTVTVLVMPVG